MKSYEDVAELSIEILDQFQGKGLVTLLIQKIIRKDNLPMLKLALKSGFEITSEEEDVVFVEKVIKAWKIQYLIYISC